MSEVTHEYPRAYKAATEVDPLILAQALDHIARTAAKSRSQTRRTRWIEQRALVALRGDEYRDVDLDLPKSAGPNTAEKLQRRMAWHIAQKHQLLAALVKAEELVARRWGYPDEASSRASTLEEMRAAIANTQEGGAL